MSGLARTLAGVDIERPLPPLWNEFDALARVPMLVIRGAQFRHPVGGHGGGDAGAARRKWKSSKSPTRATSPLLEGDNLLRGIIRFVEDCEIASRSMPTTTTSR